MAIVGFFALLAASIIIILQVIGMHLLCKAFGGTWWGNGRSDLISFGFVWAVGLGLLFLTIANAPFAISIVR